MKKLAILGLPVLAIVGLTACSEDTDPKIDTSKEFTFKLNTPQLAGQFIDLSTKGTLEFTVSQPDYGITVVPTYGLEISLNENFEPITDEPVIDEEGETHVVPGSFALNLDSQLRGILVVKMSNVAAGINELRGVFDESAYVDDYVGPLYVRATAYLGSGLAAEATATVSNTIILAQVQGYPSFVTSKDPVLLSLPGNANDWNHLGQVLYVGDSEDGEAMIFKGFAEIKGAFKVTDGDWDGEGNWGMAENGITESDGTFEFTLIQNSQTDFNKDGIIPDGLYYVYAEITDMKNKDDNAEVGKVTLIPITSISLPGDYNGWDTTANQMSTVDNVNVWSASAPVTSAGWKFAMNDSWDVNLGLTDEVLTFDGSNIFQDGSRVTLDLTQYPWSFTVE